MYALITGKALKPTGEVLVMLNSEINFGTNDDTNTPEKMQIWIESSSRSYTYGIEVDTVAFMKTMREFLKEYDK